MLWGNFYYVYMARKLAFKEKRGDVCVMPYGICTPGAFAFIYVIISLTYYECISSHDKNYCQELAWHVALASTGIALLFLCIFGEFIRTNTPSVALLSSISGLGFAILALNEYLPIAETPIVAFLPFTIVMLGYFGGVSYGPLLSIAIGTIQSVESAKRAGDFYPTREAMFVDGIGTLFSTFFGSILSMTAYIGQPAMKKMGAKQAYSLMHGLSYLPLCFLGFSGVLISIIAVVAINLIVIIIGLVICADTLAITPQRHYPAFLLGTMSIVADWAQGTIMNSVSMTQRRHWIKGQEIEPDDLSSIEWAEWKREQALEEQTIDEGMQMTV